MYDIKMLPVYFDYEYRYTVLLLKACNSEFDIHIGYTCTSSCTHYFLGPWFDVHVFLFYTTYSSFHHIGGVSVPSIRKDLGGPLGSLYRLDSL